MDKIIGFVGCGNMAQAMIGGIIDSGLVTSENVYVSNPIVEQLDLVRLKYGVNVTNDNKQVAKVSDILIIAVKPHICDKVIKEVSQDLKDDVILISIAAGKTIKSLEAALGEKKVKIVRTMPNTPVQVGEGMSVIVKNGYAGNDDLKIAEEVFSSFGRVEYLDEKYFDGATAVSGSSPACIYILIEALADAAVQAGIPRDKAYTMAAQTVKGAAEMVLETGIHPGELKDRVCSPGGTSIEAVAVLEKEGFRSAVISAIKASAQKSKELSKDDK
ncbi:MAG TPA: pyrroline-5-carboxylate reductase [Eubacteriaceae bacterium]|jgi:pyrroline-5-carboxylate reductase|nr:pyrroline-5-carboxylate reductase [Eubacteriaceae bacterium]